MGIVKSSLEKRYQQHLNNILDYGDRRKDRTGVGSRSLFNLKLNWNLISNNFPLITGRQMYPKVFKTEFDWFINGETNIKRFQDAGVSIWDSWADENGDLGPVYGHQMRNFNSQGIDQLKNVIESLKTDRDSRRHIISLWNPAEQSKMALPPCYLYFQFYVDTFDNLNMFVVQRSGDMFLGIPYDMALFSQILLYTAEQTNLTAAAVNLNIVDAHIYNNQLDAVKEYLKQDTFPPASFTYEGGNLEITNYQHGPRITCPVAV
jgi:thymidylate synthase